MAAKSELSKLLANHPDVDAKVLREALSIIRELQAGGVEPKGYDLDSPFAERLGPMPKTTEDRDSAAALEILAEDA